MTIQEDIREQMKLAMKESNTKLRDFLRVVLGEFTRIDKIVTDEQALKVIKKMNKDAESLGNDYEMKILGNWIPQMLDEHDLTRLIANIIADNEYVEMSDLGKIMQELKKHSGVDMKLANKYTKEIIINDKI